VTYDTGDNRFFLFNYGIQSSRRNATGNTCTDGGAWGLRLFVAEQRAATAGLRGVNPIYIYIHVCVCSSHREPRPVVGLGERVFL